MASIRIDTSELTAKAFNESTKSIFNFRSVDYLKSLLSFPKHLIDAGMLDALTEEVIKHHDEVHDVAQAEELYISLCQQLDGYGQETFMARNEEGAEVMLGISVSGVIVGNAGSHKFYP